MARENTRKCKWKQKRAFWILSESRHSRFISIK